MRTTIAILLGVLAIGWPSAQSQSEPEKEQVRAGARRLLDKGRTEQWFVMHNKGARVPGWLRLSTRAEDGLIVLEDEMFVKANGEETRHLQFLKCKPDEYLSPVSIYVEAKRPAKPWRIDAGLKDGTLIAKGTSGAGGGEGIAELRPNFTTDFGVMHLVSLMPATKGYSLSVLQMFEKPAIEESVLRFEREEKAGLPGAEVEATKYVLSNANSSDRVYWVDVQGQLVKIQVYGRIEFFRSDEATAKNIPASLLASRPSPRPTSATPKPPAIKEAAIPVFPGAEGFGSRTPAGRGGKVIEVTSLADNGPGSLRAAVAQAGPRIIVFRVGGTIELKSQLNVSQPFVTMAGQTAPGDGILLKDFGLVIQTHDVLVQHLRVRPGNEGKINPEDNDAVQVNGGSNVFIDHVSASWGEDEVVQTWDMAHDVTFSWCLISEALDKSRHPKGRHAGGVILGEGSDRITMHHCLLADLDFRNPLIINSGAIDLVENVIFNWGRTGGEIHDNAGFSARVNVIGNRYIKGPSSIAPEFVVHKDEKPGSVYPKIFARDNIGPRRESTTANEFALFSLGFGNTPLPADLRANQPFESRSITRSQGSHLLDTILAGAGANPDRRDAVDKRIIESVRKGEGRIINSPSEVGGFPTIEAGAAPLDSDHDGIPDEWETKLGLNPKDAADAIADRNGDGYTNLEEYLYELANLKASVHR